MTSTEGAPPPDTGLRNKSKKTHGQRSSICARPQRQSRLQNCTSSQTGPPEKLGENQNSVQHVSEHVVDCDDKSAWPAPHFAAQLVAQCHWENFPEKVHVVAIHIGIHQTYISKTSTQTSDFVQLTVCRIPIRNRTIVMAQGSGIKLWKNPTNIQLSHNCTQRVNTAAIRACHTCCNRHTQRTAPRTAQHFAKLKNAHSKNQNRPQRSVYPRD